MIKNNLVRATALALALSLLGPMSYASEVLSHKAFKNCTELRQTYPGGVAISTASRNIGGKTKKSPSVNSRVYFENKKMDRDGDGIACEN